MLGQQRTEGSSELFHSKQLPAAAGNRADESRETEPKWLENQNNKLKAAETQSQR